MDARGTTRSVPDGHGPSWLRRDEERKRHIYSVAATTGIAVTVLSWATREPDDLLIEIGYPILAVALAAFIVATLRRWLPLHLLERAILVVLSVVLIGRLAWHLLLSDHIDERLLVLVGGHYWAIATLIVAGFVLLDRRGGLRFGLGVLAVSIALVVVGAGPQLIGPDGSSQALLYLLRVHGFLATLLVLVLAVSSLREQLQLALTRAEAYAELATTDPLTGIGNRRAATEALGRELQAAQRHGRALSVVVLDLDHFKGINDRYGHEVGDQVLAEVAALLRDRGRELDLVARWGGEEFLIVAPETTHLDAMRLAERVRARIAQRRFGEVRVTATLGVTQHRPGEDLATLLRRADQLLYSAKAAGRDQVLGADIADLLQSVDPPGALGD